MPTHTAPNHPDCKIDCPNGGYAFYIPPSGPCQKDCNNATLGGKLASSIRSRGWQVKSYGSVRNLTKKQVVQIARDLRNATSPSDRNVSNILDELDRAESVPGPDDFDVEWSDAEGLQVIKAIRDAAIATPLADA